MLRYNPSRSPSAVTVPSPAPVLTNRSRILANASVDAACLQPDVVDATAPHRDLPVGFGVALNDKDVELGLRPDPDHRHRLPRLTPVRADE